MSFFREELVLSVGDAVGLKYGVYVIVGYEVGTDVGVADCEGGSEGAGVSTITSASREDPFSVGKAVGLKD
jgi:hypothetical protein